MRISDWSSDVCSSDLDLFRKPATAVDAGELSAEERNKAEILKMEKVRQRIDAIVGDAATAEALKPYYHYFCKRPGFSDDYLQVFNRANVTLVDTAKGGRTGDDRRARRRWAGLCARLHHLRDRL